MAWWNPKTWIGKTAAEPVTPEPIKPLVWVEMRPERAHMGIDFYSDAPENPYPCAICVTGMTLAQARVELVGKVINWDRLTPAQLDGIESGTPPRFSHDELKVLFYG